MRPQKHSHIVEGPINSCRTLITQLLLVLTNSIIAVLVSNACFGSEYPQKISFQDVMEDQDIALGEVEAIIQDHEGFIWLGGRNDLLRFDGRTYSSVLAEDYHNQSQAHPLRHVQEMLNDQQNRLWAAGHLGLHRYDSDRELFISIKLPQENPNSDQPQTINALAETPSGHILAGAGNGLYVLNSATVPIIVLRNHAPKTNSLPSKTILDILVDQHGTIWLGMNEGLVKLKKDFDGYTLIIPYPNNSQSFSHNAVHTIAEDHQGNIWFGTNYGVYRLNPKTGEKVHYIHDPSDPLSLANDITRHIVVDHQGWVWVGSDQGGISLYNATENHFVRFQHQEGKQGSLTSNTIRHIYEDRSKNLWVGTYPSGVNFYDRSSAAITHIAKDTDLNKGLLKNSVEALEVDNYGNLWIGAGGITKYNLSSREFFHYQHAEGNTGTPSNSILNGCIDSQGNIYFGSWGHGILQYKEEEDRFVALPADTTLVQKGISQSHLLNDKMVWSVYEDSQNTLWISTHFNGLTRYDKKTGLYDFFPPDDKNPTAISNPVTWGTFEDSSGRFWVGTSRGLNLMDRQTGTFKVYLPDTRDPNSLANASILSIFEDHKNRLWFGTDAGLHLFQPDSDDFLIFNSSNGFLDEAIRAITEDHLGNLWLGTNNGITLFNPDTLKVRNFSRHNGKTIGGVATGAGIALPDGKVAFGARSGVYIFDTAKLTLESKGPPVVFTEFRLFTKKVGINDSHNILSRALNQTETITLNHTHSMISIGFSALSYREPDKNQYAYKLEGFDENWRQAVNQRDAIYTNLPAGKYIFHVKASNSDGVWNHQGRQINLHVLPPPWLSWWAYLLYTSLVLLSVTLFIRQQHNRVHRQRAINKLLEAKVEERTIELKNKNQELETAYNQLERISTSDPLTGLYNRRHLQHLIPLDAAKIQRIYRKDIHPNTKADLGLTFFILDIDFFKPVNDQFGHGAGDQLLIQISQRLTATCQASDCIVRWGGEEFLIVSRYEKRSEALTMAERLRHCIEASNFEMPNGNSIQKTCSIGFASYPFIEHDVNMITWEQVVDIADRALYAAKKSGRNRSVGLSATANTQASTVQSLNSCAKDIIAQHEIAVLGPQDPPLLWD